MITIVVVTQHTVPIPLSNRGVQALAKFSPVSFRVRHPAARIFLAIEIPRSKGRPLSSLPFEPAEADKSCQEQVLYSFSI